MYQKSVDVDVLWVTIAAGVANIWYGAVDHQTCLDMGALKIIQVAAGGDQTTS